MSDAQSIICLLLLFGVLVMVGQAVTSKDKSNPEEKKEEPEEVLSIDYTLVDFCEYPNEIKLGDVKKARDNFYGTYRAKSCN